METANDREIERAALNPARLRHQLYIRGWDQQDLVRAAGIAEGTVSKACTTGDVSPRIARKIAGALAKQAPIPELEELATA